MEDDDPRFNAGAAYDAIHDESHAAALELAQLRPTTREGL
jgi:hypothetical protein